MATEGRQRQTAAMEKVFNTELTELTDNQRGLQ